MKYSFKHPHIKKEFDEGPLLLQYLAEDFIIKSNSYGIAPVITRILEPIEGESGVHQDYRAIDFRDEFNGELTYPEAVRDEVLNYMNLKWYRNDGKKTLIHHSFNNGPAHFHLQISLSTLCYWIKS